MVIDETIEAYADCNCMADGPRNLDFLASQWVDWQTCYQAFWHAIEGGYNNFTADRLKRGLSGIKERWRHGVDLGWDGYRGLEYRPARESSVCLYVRGEGIKKIADDGLGADEVSLEYGDMRHWAHSTDLDELEMGNYILRLWWD